MGMTLTQNIFACCFFLIGPLWGFLLSGFAAYAGWFVSGMIAMNVYPDYPRIYPYRPYLDPPEHIAVLFTISGFLTGFLGVYLVRKFGARRPKGSSPM